MRTVTGTWALARLALRRDRVQLAAWLLGLALVLWAVAASIEGLYPSEEQRVAAVSFGAGSVVARAFEGPAMGTSLGAITFVESYVMLAVLTGLMSSFAVVRHTRREEESGRAELLGAGVVGRHAALTASLLVVVGANLTLAVLTSLVLVGVGLPVAGSVLTGAALAGVGVVLAGVAAVAAQIFESSRAANGAAAAVLGVAFLLRAVGDGMGEVASSGLEVVSAWPSWLSPIGWGQQTRPFQLDRWEPLLLHAGLALVLVAAAVALASHRDVGTGMLPVRPGPARADERLLSPSGLTWRMQRGMLLGWLIGLTVIAAVFGAIGDEAGELIATSEEMAEVFAAVAGEADLVASFHAVVMGMLGTVTGGFVVQALLRMRAEEVGGSLEPILATAVGRVRWMAGHLVVAGLGAAGLLVASGLAAGLAYGLAAGDVLDGLVTLLGAGLVQIPATLALGGLVVAVFGLWPRWSPGLAWGAFVVFLLMGQVGALLDLPQAVLNVSPYTHLPAVPADDLTVLPLIALGVAAAALGAVGVERFRRRDLAL